MSKHRWKHGKFYEVVWEDIIAYSGWTEGKAESQSTSQCKSHGYLSDYVPGKSGYIRLSGTISNEPELGEIEYNQHIVIPLKVIKEITLK
jgi:hypothetical protein